MRAQLLITSCFIFVTSYALGDLVDDYVKHVQEVNKRKTNTFRTKSRNPSEFSNYGFSDFDAIPRFRRGLGKSVNNRRKRNVFDDELDQWTHSEVLDRDGAVILRWQPRHQEILFRVEARTRGYIGIGFSPNGGMEDADIVIGWVDDRNGRAYLHVSICFWYLVDHK